MYDHERVAAIRQAELSLLGSPSRNDTARVEKLLHPSFVEIGRSGQRWERATIIEELATEQPRPAPETDEWIFDEIAEDLFLVTFRIRGEAGDSRHSSIWDLREGAPRMRFHQGTRVAGETPAV